MKKTKFIALLTLIFITACEPAFSQDMVEKVETVFDLITKLLISLSAIATILAGAAVRFGLIKKKDAEKAGEIIEEIQSAVNEGEKVFKEITKVMDESNIKTGDFVRISETLGLNTASSFIKKHLDPSK